MDKNIRKNKKIIPNQKNLPITQYWSELPSRSYEKEYLLKRISKVTGRESNSVRRWFLGISEPPSPRIKQQVADILSCNVESLFTTINN